MSLASALERAAEALPEAADAIWPANGDPLRLLEELDAAAASQVLAWLLSHEADNASELVEVWAEQARGREVLLALDAADLPKAGRKALRRLHHRLRSQGVALGEPAPEPRVAALPPVDDAFEAALVTPLDPSGTRLVYLVEPDPAGGARLFEVAVDEARGILDMSVYRAGRSKVRGFLREVTGRRGLAGVPAPPESVRALIARAAERQPAHRRPPAAFLEWRGHVTRTAPGAVTPGALAAEALGESADRELLRNAEVLVREGRLGPWPADRELLAPIAAEMREKAASPLLVNPVQRREQAETVLGEALADLYGGDPARVLAERFREAAYGFWKGDDEASAQACLAAAAAFVSLTPEDNPLARTLLDVVFAPVLEAIEKEHAGDEPPESGGIVAP